MKFIRDIINDKRSAEADIASRPSEAPASAWPQEPTETDAAKSALVYSQEEEKQTTIVEAPEEPMRFGQIQDAADESIEDDDSPAKMGEPNIFGHSLNATGDVKVTQEETPAEDAGTPDTSATEMLSDWTETDPVADDAPEAAQTEPMAAKEPEGTDETLPGLTGHLKDPFEKLGMSNGHATEPSSETDGRSIVRNIAKLRTNLSETPVPTPSTAASGQSEASQTTRPDDTSQINLADAVAQVAGAAPQDPIDVPAPAIGRGASRSRRAKTRLLGFTGGAYGQADPFQKQSDTSDGTFPVAWLVVVSGPGRGASFALHDGVAKIGRGEDQTVSLNFGDNSISRENHVSVAYDSEQNNFFIGQSGKSNLVRLNDKPLLSTEQVRSGDLIRVGETTLHLVALCGDGFRWEEPVKDEAANA